MAYFLGIDVSTTGVKALLMDEQGQVVGTANTEQPLYTPYPLWSEQNPQDWWNGAVNSIRTVLSQSGVDGSQVLGVGLTGQMHGLTLLDEEGNVLRPAILWNDQRTAQQCDEIRARLGKSRLIQITGNDALTGFTAPKILWVREHEPEVYARVRHILLPKDYVRYRLTGEFAVDCADGAGTILFDLRQRTWSDEVLKAMDIPLEWLPKTYEGPEITGRITPEAAQATGLKQGTPVMAGGGDQAAQAVGVGAVQPGIVALTLGTSGVVFATTGEPFIEPEGRLHAFCHSVPGRWHLMGVMLSAAGSLRWYRDALAPGVSYDDLLAPAADVPMGSEGLLFLPYLTGERTPHPDPLARGAFVGLTVRHTRAHMTRAVLEGVAFGLRDGFELMKSAGLTHIEQVRVSGGGARSPLWRQILADVFDAELVTVNTTEGAAYGAALLAGVGAGIWKTVDEACSAAIRITGSTAPRPEGVSFYQKAYQGYRQLYPALRDLSHALSEW
ncbi:xylulokinase [Anaerolinea thermophila]|uniref:Xylulose kinase n=1 Tax=Anaerolinea thermophila (strain DSM 14523 / JCM 11388 / NBRC 100420 / UNI-1) TaxID=926569 RepID=E8MZG9_ANATU|nr:xylulokinase [Anaerolinea thermophila]BAJ64517.1 xylulose kinase [Anaerolinea thermophila UNI-1]